MRNLISRRGFGLIAWAWVQAQGEAVVDIRGDVQRPQKLDREQLAAMPAADQGTSSLVREVDGQQRQTTSRGVRLKALLDRAGLAERDRTDWRHTVVVACARDGYRVVFSWPELFNTASGEQVLLLYEHDGAPLRADEGPFALLAAGDLRTGPRHVKWLTTIEVRVLRD
jgi:DMSO/TMAO reductase YedYZ molybdopterin-dependent catalytic subunit